MKEAHLTELTHRYEFPSRLQCEVFLRSALNDWCSVRFKYILKAHAGIECVCNLPETGCV